MSQMNSTPIREIGNHQILNAENTGAGQWKLFAGSPLVFNPIEKVAEIEEREVFYEYFTITTSGNYEIAVNSSFSSQMQLFEDDGVLDDSDYLTESNMSYSPSIDYTLQPGNYVLAFGDDPLTVEEAVAGKNSINADIGKGIFSLSIQMKDDNPMIWKANDPALGWGVAGNYIDLDPTTPEGPFYRIIDNGYVDITIEDPDGTIPDAAFFSGKSFIGVHRFNTLKVSGGAKVDFGEDRVLVEDLTNSAYDIYSNITADSQSVLPPQQ